MAGPLERAAIARNAERVLRLDHLDGSFVQREEAKEVWVRQGIEGDLQQDTG